MWNLQCCDNSSALKKKRFFQQKLLQNLSNDTFWIHANFKTSLKAAVPTAVPLILKIFFYNGFCNHKYFYFHSSQNFMKLSNTLLTFINNTIVPESTNIAIFPSKCPSKETFASITCKYTVVKFCMSITTNCTDCIAVCEQINVYTTDCKLRVVRKN